MGNETRERLALRMQPKTRRRIEQWYVADNCLSMNEFVEKAVNFYVDHLEIQDNQTLLPMAIQSAIDGRLRRMEDYIARSNFTSVRDGSGRFEAQTGAERPECKGHKRYHLSGEVCALPSGAGLG